MIFRQALGVTAIFTGIALIIWALSGLIFRIALAIAGLWLINYGMFLCHYPPLFMWVHRFYRKF